MPENTFGLADNLCNPMKELAKAFKKAFSYVFINKVKNIKETKAILKTY